MIQIRIIFSIILSLTLFFNTTYAANNQDDADGFYGFVSGTSAYVSAHSGSSTTSTDNPLPNAGNFIQAGITAGNNLNTSRLVTIMDDSFGVGLTNILKLLYQIGTLVAVCVFAFIGVKFITTSPQQKAQLKDSLVPFFVGLLFFVAGVPIAILIINILLQFL